MSGLIRRVFGSSRRSTKKVEHERSEERPAVVPVTPVAVPTGLDNSLVRAGSAVGVDFNTVPEEGWGLATAVANCCDLIPINYDSAVKSMVEKPELRNPNVFTTLVLHSIALALIFVAYPDDERELNGERIRPNSEKTKRLRENLRVIVGYTFMMDAIAELHLAGNSGPSVVDILKSHAKLEATAQPA